MTKPRHPLEPVPSTEVPLSSVTQALVSKKRPDDTIIQARLGDAVATFPIPEDPKEPLTLQLFIRVGGREFAITVSAVDRGATGYPRYEVGVVGGAHSFVLAGEPAKSSKRPAVPNEEGYVMGVDGVPIRAAHLKG